MILLNNSSEVSCIVASCFLLMLATESQAKNREDTCSSSAVRARARWSMGKNPRNLQAATLPLLLVQYIHEDNTKLVCHHFLTLAMTMWTLHL